MRKQAVQMYVDGMNLRRIARHFGIHHRTVSLWVQASAASLPEAPVPKEVKTAEMDELFTFIGNKKTGIYILTIVDRQTRCYLGWKVVWERTQPAIQEMVDDAPKAKQYYSDAFDAYDRLWYHFGRYEVSEGKTDTYSVEGDNAELRHYLARLARSSRCFSRCPYALECAVRLFVYCYNRRQLYKQQYPAYPAHVKDFLDPLF